MLNKLRFDDTILALLALLIICALGIIMKMDGAKEIALTVTGGIIGYLKGSSSNQPPALPEQPKS